VSTTTNPQIDLRAIEETRRHINRLIDEISRLSEAELSPPEYYNEVLKRVLTAMAAPAAAIWTTTPQGGLQLGFQINLREVGLDEEGRKIHDELLRHALQTPQPLHLPPHSSFGAGQEGRPAPGNPTDYLLLLVPVMLNSEVQGFVEVWQARDRPLNAVQGFLQFLGTISDLVARYQRNRRVGQMAGQEQLWIQLEAFSRQAHATLNPTEAAYLIANEGRRLVDCDRLSVGIRMSRKTRIESVSGSDVVEKRSNLVKLMRKLYDAVLRWGEKLVYTGIKDDSLPPDVLKALDAYLAESNSKILVLLPLRDEREKESKKPPRSGLLMECFETTEESQELIGRLEVVGRHSVSALYNAIEYRRIPFRWVWLPMAKLQEGLGGRGRAIAVVVLLALVALGSVLYLYPMTLKMDGKGKLLPITRYQVYTPDSGTILGIYPNSKEKTFGEGANLIDVFSPDIAKGLAQLEAEIKAAQASVELAKKNVTDANAKAEDRKALVEATAVLTEKQAKRDALTQGLFMNADKLGQFFVRSPNFTPEENVRRDRFRTEYNLDRNKRGMWTMLSTDQRENLVGKRVDPTVPLMRIGDLESGFEVELRIPQKHVYQIKSAFERLGVDELDVDLKVRSEPTQTFKGKLPLRRIGGEATAERDDNNEPEPVVVAYVELDHKDIPMKDRVPLRLRTTGIEVLTKIRCGEARAGYVLFYGVWEFICEKILFAF
jgi:hypothetical protein